MRRTRYVVLPVKSWQYMGLMVVSLACLTLGLVSRDRGGRSGSLAGPELKHTAPHEVDACPNLPPFGRMSPYDETALKKGPHDNSRHARSLIRVRNARNSNDRVSWSSSIEHLQSGNMKRGKQKIAIQDRQAFITDRRIGTISMLPTGVNRSNRQSSEPSRILESRKIPSELSREKRNEIDYYRSGPANRGIRKTSRSPEAISHRATRSGPLEFRERHDSTTRQRRTNVQERRSRINDRRSRETLPIVYKIREVRSERQRLISREHDRRSGDRREDRVARNRSVEEKSVDRRNRDFDRRARIDGLSSRSVRSFNERDNRNDRSIRMSRSRDNRRETITDDRRSDEKIRAKTPDDDERHYELVTKRSTDVDRRDIRKSVIKSDPRRTRSADIDRANIRSIRVHSQERKSEKHRERESMAVNKGRVELSTRTRGKNRIMNESERQERRVNVLTSARNARQRLWLSADRVDVERTRRRSEERSSAERREINELEHRKVRNDLTIRSHDVKQSRSPSIARSIVRRVDTRLRQRQIVSQPDFKWLERTERKIDRSSRRLYDERRERLTDRSEIRRSTERRNQMQDQTSKLPIIEQASRTNYLRRNVRSSKNSENTKYPERSERFIAIRDISREARTSTMQESRRISSMGLSTRSVLSKIVDSVDDVSQGRREHFNERVNAEKSRSSDQRRTSTTRELRKRSGMNALRGNNRNSRISSIATSERHERFLTRDISQERHDRLAERNSVAREIPRSRINDRIDPRQGRTMNGEIRASRSGNNRKFADELSGMSLMNVRAFADVRKMSRIENREYLQQALVLVLCAIYGASLLKRKGGFYSFSNIINHQARFVTA